MKVSESSEDFANGVDDRESYCHVLRLSDNALFRVAVLLEPVIIQYFRDAILTREHNIVEYYTRHRLHPDCLEEGARVSIFTELYDAIDAQGMVYHDIELLYYGGNDFQLMMTELARMHANRNEEMDMAHPVTKHIYLLLPYDPFGEGLGDYGVYQNDKGFTLDEEDGEYRFHVIALPNIVGSNSLLGKVCHDLCSADPNDFYLPAFQRAFKSVIFSPLLCSYMKDLDEESILSYEEGVEEGRTLKKIEIARRLYQEGMESENIIRICEITPLQMQYIEQE